MGLSPYIIGGLATGVGQGISNAPTIMANRRKENRDERRIAAQEERQRIRDEQNDRRLDLQEQRQQQAYDRGILSEDMDFVTKGGVIEDDPTDNGTGKIGLHVGISTASMQPSEHQGIPMREVGRFGGKKYSVPSDGLTPAERLKQRGRESRASTVAGQQYYKPRPDEIEALDDPEIGDDTYKDIRARDWALDPRNVNAQAAIAGARAAATYPYKDHGSEKDADGLTPAQRLTANRMNRGQFISQANATAMDARRDVEKEPKRGDYGYSGVWMQNGTNPDGSTFSKDSVDYDAASRAANKARIGARFRGGMANFSADSAARAGQHEGKGLDPDSPQITEREGIAKIQRAYEIYTQALADAKTPEDKKEARELYLTIRNQALTAIGRKPRDPNN